MGVRIRTMGVIILPRMEAARTMIIMATDGFKTSKLAQFFALNIETFIVHLYMSE